MQIRLQICLRVLCEWGSRGHPYCTQWRKRCEKKTLEPGPHFLHALFGACSVDNTVATMGFSCPSLLRFLCRVGCEWGPRNKLIDLRIAGHVNEKLLLNPAILKVSPLMKKNLIGTHLQSSDSIVKQVASYVDLHVFLCVACNRVAMWFTFCLRTPWGNPVGSHRQRSVLFVQISSPFCVRHRCYWPGSKILLREGGDPKTTRLTQGTPLPLLPRKALSLISFLSLQFWQKKAVGQGAKTTEQMKFLLLCSESDTGRSTSP